MKEMRDESVQVMEQRTSQRTPCTSHLTDYERVLSRLRARLLRPRRHPTYGCRACVQPCRQRQHNFNRLCALIHEHVVSMIGAPLKEIRRLEAVAATTASS
jgi:hypothetical protein